MYGLYRNLTSLISPLMPYWLEQRRKKGKEDGNRLQERFGKPSHARPEGKLLWVHAASIGESNAALPLIKKILESHASLHILLTTGTVTSAELMRKCLPPRAFHQFVPIDTPKAVKEFVRYWHPNVGLFIDSEFWPNLIIEAAHNGTIMGLVNARMSESSYRSWKWGASLVRMVLGTFRFCSAQSKKDAEKLLDLGVKQVHHVGNLKYDVPPLECDADELANLKAIIGDRPVWLAASTHPGEEEIVAQAHRSLRDKHPNLLTIIVPRHAHRGEVIAEQLIGLKIARRSKRDNITNETDIYIADTMGELGLFYRLAHAALIGGSLVPHGGQNPIEAVLLSCPIILGQYMNNFQSVVRRLEEAEACLRVIDTTMLYGAVSRVLGSEHLRKQMSQKALIHIRSHAGSIDVIVTKLQPYLAQ